METAFEKQKYIEMSLSCVYNAFLVLKTGERGTLSLDDYPKSSDKIANAKLN